MHRSADGISAEISFLEGKDRSVGDCTKAAQGEIALMGDTCAVDRHQAPEQNGMWRERRRPLQYFRKGEVGIPHERNPVFEGLHFPLCLLKPEFLQGRG